MVNTTALSSESTDVSDIWASLSGAHGERGRTGCDKLVGKSREFA